MSRSFFQLATALCAFTAINGFSDDAQVRNLENRVNALEQRKGSNSMILPPAGPNLSNDVGIMFDLEFLYLRPQVSGLAIGQYQNLGSAPNQLTSVIQPNWKLDPGARVMLGFRPGHDAWQINAVWTYLHSRFSQNVTPVSGVGIANPFDLSGKTASSVSARWRLNVNVADLDVSRYYYASKHLAMRPSFGLRSAWLYQTYYTNYTGTGTAPAIGSNIYNNVTSNNVWGLGPKAGMDTSWCLGSGFKIFGELDLSALWSVVKVSEVQLRDSTTQLKGQRNVYHTVVPVLDAALGLGWERNFDEDQYQFGLSAAWEFHSYFNQNQFETLHMTYGNLSLQGLRIAATFDF